MNGWARAWIWLLVCFIGAVWQPVQAQSVVRYYVTDALGSVVVVTDESGSVMERREYEPYGAQLTPAVQDGPGYTGHVQDAATGLVYMQQRYYDPQLGVFLSVDPVTAYEQPISQFHRYRYANNNPYRFTDPDGRYSCDGSKGQCDQVAAFREKLGEARDGLQKGTDAYAKVDRVIQYLGDHNDDNGVTVRPTSLDPGTTGQSSNGADVISIDLKQIADVGGQYADVTGAGTLAHEARHELDAKDHGAAVTKAAVFRTELNAYRTNAAVGQGLRMDVGMGSDKKINDAAQGSTDAWCAQSGGSGC